MGIVQMIGSEFCEKLVQSSSLIIGHNVLMTDDTGYVIASADTARVGTLHGASIDAIRTGQKAYHNQEEAVKYVGTKPGMTIPIVMNKVCVGTIGITGMPDEISRYADLIQQMTQIFLDFSERQYSSVLTDTKKQNLIRDIIAFDETINGEEEIIRLAQELGLEITAPHMVLLFSLAKDDGAYDTDDVTNSFIETMPKYLNAAFRDVQDFVCMLGNSEFIVLASAPYKTSGESYDDEIARRCESILFVADEFPMRIGAGTCASSVKELRTSYENARFASRVIAASGKGAGYLSIRDAALEQMILGIPPRIYEELAGGSFAAIMNAKNREEILVTIDAWCEQKFNFIKTAEALHIHKSTLVYRFRRMKETYGIDRDDFRNILTLYLLHLRSKFD